jgi:STE24 endopeptidase
MVLNSALATQPPRPSAPQALRLPAPAKEVAHLFDGDRFATQQAYQVDKLRFGTTHRAWDAALSVTLLLNGFLPRSWRAAGAALALAGVESTEIRQSVIWTLLMGVFSTVLSLPWSAYSTFVVEARHGFNQTTLKTFAADIFKSALVALALAPPLVAAIVSILSRAGPAAPFYLWAFLLATSLVLMNLYPAVIAPLFNTFTPLPDGPLRSQIESLAASLRFPLRRLYEVDGSRRSAHSNAYMYGMGSNKRIVLYDTLIKQCSEEQVVAVLAHELGHWKLRHTPVLFAAGQGVLLAQMAL